MWDDGMITEGEFHARLGVLYLDPPIAILREGKPLFSITGGCGSWEAEHEHIYVLLDWNAFSQHWYPMSLKNLVRIFWNRMMRRLGLYRWQWLF
jgi:hypothetical protein